MVRGSCRSKVAAATGKGGHLARLRHTLWLMGLLLAGCTLIPPVPELPTPVRPPDIRSSAEALQATVEGDLAPDVLTIRYEMGNEAWDGRTTVTLQGSGAVEVTFDRGEQHQTWQSSLGSDEFLTVCRLLVEHNVWTIRGQRETGVPDEAYTTVSVQADGFEPLIVGMWHGEAVDHPDFGPIVDTLAGLARDISGGVAR
jgi:hypothetical protein